MGEGKHLCAGWKVSQYKLGGTLVQGGMHTSVGWKALHNKLEPVILYTPV